MMNRKILFWPLAAMLLTACEKGLEDDIADVGSGQVKNAMLQVRTRAGGSAADGGVAVSYPVSVFVFSTLPPGRPSDSSPQAGAQECCAIQTIGDEGQTLNIALTEGIYQVYAVGGAAPEDYVMPSAASEVSASSPIALRESSWHSDLMTASAAVTLTDGGTNTVTLGMERRTMLLQAVTISRVPTAATAVSLTVAPLWQSLTVSGDFANAGGSTTIALEKQADNRTWTMAQPLPAPQGEGSGVGSVFLLPPSSQPASITVNITIGGTTKSYTYSSSDELEAGYKISIEGTYTEAVGVSLSGTIEGATWKGERTITFTFNESSVVGGSPTDDGNDESDDDDDDGDDSGDGTVSGGSPAGSFPQAGDTYQGCYVLTATVATDGESAELTLLSPNERTTTGNTGMQLSTLQYGAAQCGTDDISDWRPMTRSEALLLQAVHTDLGISDSAYYLFDNDGTVKQMRMQNAAVSNPTSAAAIIRAVATVSVSKD